MVDFVEIHKDEFCKKLQRAKTILRIAMCVCSIIAVFSCAILLTYKLYTLAVASVVICAGAIAVAVAKQSRGETVAYYYVRFIEQGRVTRKTVQFDDDIAVIEISVEKDDHVVMSADFDFPVVSKTDVSAITLDVEASVVYVPYSSASKQQSH